MQMMKRWAQVLLGALALAAFATPAAAQRQSEGFTFLKAVRDRDGATATTLLEQPGGSTLANARDLGTGETGLHIVTQRRDGVWMRFLLSKGADPNREDKNGVVPLQLAAQLGFVEGVEILLGRGAEVDPTNGAGETPLISAVHRRDTAMIRLLISNGANPDRADGSGRSARDYATLMGSGSQVLEELERAEAEQGQQSKTYGPS